MRLWYTVFVRYTLMKGEIFMQNRKYSESSVRFRRRFTCLSHVFWMIVLLDALYIAGYVLAFFVDPSAAAEKGMLLSQVPPMMEHVLMSALLLTAAGVSAETVVRSV